MGSHADKSIFSNSALRYSRQSLLATILYKAQVENGIIILLMRLFIKNTATEKPQAWPI